MNADYRLKTTTLLAVTALLAICLTGCAAKKAYERGLHAEVNKNFDTAMTEYKAAFDKDPQNLEFRLKYEQARYNAAFAHFEAGGPAFLKKKYSNTKKGI